MWQIAKIIIKKNKNNKQIIVIGINRQVIWTNDKFFHENRENYGKIDKISIKIVTYRKSNGQARIC